MKNQERAMRGNRALAEYVRRPTHIRDAVDDLTSLIRDLMHFTSPATVNNAACRALELHADDEAAERRAASHG